MGGGGLIYASKLASGPSSSAGPQNPSQDTNNTYWTPVSLDDNNVMHKDSIEAINGAKFFQDNTYVEHGSWKSFRRLYTNCSITDPSSITTRGYLGGYQFVDKNYQEIANVDVYLSETTGLIGLYSRGPSATKYTSAAIIAIAK